MRLSPLLLPMSAAVFLLWALAQPAPADRSHLADSLGPDPTHTIWARPLPAPVPTRAPEPAPAGFTRPSAEALIAGTACVEL